MIKNNLTSHFLSIKNIIRKYFQINDNNNYMKRNFKLIKLNPADWKYYKKIHLEALKTEPQAFETSFSDAVKKSNKEWKSLLEPHTEKNPTILIFLKDRINNKIIGFTGVHSFSQKEMTIICFYIQNEYRGLNLGKILMKNLINQVKKIKKYRKIILDVNFKQRPALFLYKSFGFHKVSISKI